jgi:hypothetical protein
MRRTAGELQRQCDEVYLMALLESGLANAMLLAMMIPAQAYRPLVRRL